MLISLKMSAKARRFLSGAQIATFQQMVAKAETAGANEATKWSRDTFRWHLSGRPHIPARAGRLTTMGQFENHIQWGRQRGGWVKFDVATLKNAARYYLIQEIGTGESANVLDRKQSVSIPSQEGRYITAGLVWASPGGDYAEAGNSRRGLDQIMPFSMLGKTQQSSALMMKGRNHTPPRIRIGREIEGKHYIRDGGMRGVEVLRNQVLQDYKKIFR